MTSPPVFRVMTVALDAGHGGKDAGAISCDGTYEKDVTLSITNKIRKKLEDKGVGVVMTRSDDRFLPLEERVSLVNRSEACFFVSVHCNASNNRSARGIEVYYPSDPMGKVMEKPGAERALLPGDDDESPEMQSILSESPTVLDLMRAENREESAGLARAISGSLKRDLGIKNRGGKEASYFVLKNADKPAVLIELGFLSNEEEASRLADPREQDHLAGLVAEGIISYKEEYERTQGFTVK